MIGHATYRGALLVGVGRLAVVGLAAIAATVSHHASTRADEGIKLPEQVYSTGYSGSAVDLVSFINTQLRQGWSDNGMRPSEPADDAEWVRRVHLDIVG